MAPVKKAMVKMAPIKKAMVKMATDKNGNSKKSNNYKKVCYFVECNF